MPLVPVNQLPVEASELDRSTPRRRRANTPIADLINNLSATIVPSPEEIRRTQQEAVRLMEGAMLTSEARPRLTMSEINGLIGQYIRAYGRLAEMAHVASTAATNLRSSLRRIGDTLRNGVISIDDGIVETTPPIVALNRQPIRVLAGDAVRVRFDSDPTRAEGVRVDVTVSR